jgi:K+/H+ antiporter YhaU regulatory subunit KhtT
VQGVISLHEVKRAFSDIDQVGTLVRAVDVMDSDVPMIPLEATLSDAMNELWRTHYDELPVVESAENPTFRGVIWEHDIIGVYNREILKQKASLMKTVRQDEGEEQTDYLELPSGYTVGQIRVPDAWRGTSIRDLGVRQKYDIMIVEIKREKGYGDIERLSPEPDMVLTSDDRLIVMGPEDKVDRLRTASWEGE